MCRLTDTCIYININMLRQNCASGGWVGGWVGGKEPQKSSQNFANGFVLRQWFVLRFAAINVYVY